VGNDNSVRIEGLKLRIPSSNVRAHYPKTCVRVHRYIDRTMALSHGLRGLARPTTKIVPL
jgi:hypothetical protein